MNLIKRLILMRLVLGIIAQTLASLKINNIIPLNFFFPQSVLWTSTHFYFLVLDPINRNERMRMNDYPLIVVFSHKHIKPWKI